MSINLTRRLESQESRRPQPTSKSLGVLEQRGRCVGKYQAVPWNALAPQSPHASGAPPPSSSVFKMCPSTSCVYVHGCVSSCNILDPPPRPDTFTHVCVYDSQNTHSLKPFDMMPQSGIAGVPPMVCFALPNAHDVLRLSRILTLRKQDHNRGFKEGGGSAQPLAFDSLRSAL